MKVWRIVRAVVLVALAFAAVASTLEGCRPYLLGTNDVELTYEVKSGSTPSSDLLERARTRLLLSHVPADVLDAPNGIRVVADAERVSAVEHALAWRGGLSIHRFDGVASTLAPADMTGLVESTAKLPDGTTTRAIAGPYEELMRAAETTSDESHRLLYDPFAEGPRVIVVRREPLVDLPNARVAADGKHVVVLAEKKDAGLIAALVKEQGDATVAYARGPRIIWIATLKKGVIAQGGDVAAVIIPRGTDIVAYSRARADARLLVTRTLPELAVTATRRLPPDFGLAAATVLLPLAAGLAWLVFIRRFDRAKPEPWWIVLATFALGALSGPLAGRIEGMLGRATPYLDPDVMTLDRRAVVFPIALAVFTVAVGAVEEGVKLLAVWALAARRRELDEPIDGILYAAAAAVGFAVEENIAYFTTYRFGDSLVAARSLGGMAHHLMFSAVWGYALGMRLVAKKTSVWRFFALAALMHGAHDTLISFGVPHGTLVSTVIAVGVFVVLVRRALRWGAVADTTSEPPASSRRTLFPVGRAPGTAACVAAMFACTALIELVGRSAEAENVRASIIVLVLSTVLLVLFGLAAWGMTVTMPLDVVLDDVGVTFAGGLRRWADIRGATRVGARALVLHAEGGDLRLGPGPRTSIDGIEAALRARFAKDDA